jgi:hypothetical protein
MIEPEYIAPHFLDVAIESALLLRHNLLFVCSRLASLTKVTQEANRGIVESRRSGRLVIHCAAAADRECTLHQHTIIVVRHHRVVVCQPNLQNSERTATAHSGASCGHVSEARGGTFDRSGSE